MELSPRAVAPSRLPGALLACMLAGCAFVTCGRAAPSASSTEVAPVSAPDAAQAHAFAIMRRSLLSADATAPRHPTRFSPASGANPLLARRVAGAGGTSAWVVPADDMVCVEVEDASASNGGTACTSDGQAAAGRLLLSASSVSAPGSVLVAGLVPDGVTQVTVEERAGASVTVPVRENVYVGELDGPVAGVTFKGAAVPVLPGGPPGAP